MAVAVTSVLLGLLRGMTREIVSLAGWVLGLVLAFFYAEPLGAMLPAEVPVPVLRTALAAALILAAVLIASALLGALLRALMAAARLSALDRLLGAVFGFARAAVVLGAAVLVAGTTPAPGSHWWKASLLLPWLEAGVAFASPLLPASLSPARGAGARA